MTHNILYYYHYCTLQLSRDNWKKKSAGVTFENKNGQYELGTYETEGIIDTTTLLIYILVIIEDDKKKRATINSLSSTLTKS